MRRLTTVQETVGCKEQEHAPDVRNWEWLQSMLEQLGVDGMSSEESDNNGEIEVVYRPKVMKWRRNIDDELGIIDKEHRRLATMHSRRGAKAALRNRSIGNTVSTRPPVCGLPACFYDENWLGKKTDQYVERTLKLSQRKFKWRKLTVV